MLAQRCALIAGSPTTTPAALHDRRAANRIEVLVVEIDAVLRHLRRAIEESGNTREGAA